MSARRARGSFHRGRTSFSAGRSDRPPPDAAENQDQSPAVSAHAPRTDPGHPPGNSDLQTLEQLKATIKENQHPHFRPIPNPHALASIYAGPLPPDLAQTLGKDTSSPVCGLLPFLRRW